MSGQSLGKIGVHNEILLVPFLLLEYSLFHTLLKMGCMGIPFWGVQVTLAVLLRIGCFHFT